MKISRKDIIAGLECFGDSTRTVTVFLGDLKNVKERIRITRRKYKHGFSKKCFEVSITIDKPNYKEKMYLNKCKREGKIPEKCLIK
jgi:hypothetical protein